MFPKKLNEGDEVRIIAPSRSMVLISNQVRNVANKRFSDLGLKLSFGKNIEKRDAFFSSDIKARVNDIHDAFSNTSVKAVITVIGGFNSNQLLEYIDWQLIKNNPKIFCGYSDITILNNAIYQKTGLITYYGPHYSTFGQKLYFDYTLDYFKKCLMEHNSFTVSPSQQWSDDKWYNNQQKRKLIMNNGWEAINNGSAKGIVIGGNLCTFNLLQGTNYFPKIKNSILFFEDDEFAGNDSAVEFDRNLQSVIHQLQFSEVRGIVIGRFQKTSKIDLKKMRKIIKSKEELSKIPIIYGVDFGHTDPKITFPIGGKVEIVANKNSKIKFIEH
ncbi:MAG: LD-carboxypeptidase [bacterium]|nr:LD-carboxypeptidase [bacterium]